MIFACEDDYAEKQGQEHEIFAGLLMNELKGVHFIVKVK